jgi:lipopolysaccharide cholinephosphotransferase
MTPVQEVELNALKEFSKIAMENDISFFLRGGSVMGAVKYQGFVPWDDDMDIAVPRKDFDKLLNVFSKDWSDSFWMASYHNGDAIHAYFPRILLKENIRKEKRLPRNNHLGFTIIDVLPLDNVPDNLISRKYYKYKVGFLRLLGSLWTYNIKDTVMTHSVWHQIIIKLLRGLRVHKLYTQNQIYDVLDRFYKGYMGKTNWSGTITGSSFDKELFPSEVWGKGTLLKFEDTKFRVPTLYDVYLRQIYGDDYRTQEPEHKKSHLKDKRIS